MACARLHAAMMARAPHRVLNDRGSIARTHRATWSLCRGMRTHPCRRRFVSPAVAAADDDAAADTSSTPLEATDADASSEDPRPQGAVVWFRQDLRLDDNQAFRAAVRAANKRGGQVLCLFVWSPEEEGDESSVSWAPGGASRVWLHHSLASMDRDIRRRYGGGG